MVNASLLAILALAVLGGCGAGESSVATDTASTATSGSAQASDESLIRGVVAEWVTASEHGNYAQACSLQTRRFTQSLLDEANDPQFNEDFTFDCPTLLEASADIEGSDAKVSEVRIQGSKGTATVDSSTWRFAQVSGDWLIDYAN